MSEQYPLRSERKRRTHAALLEAAVDLFSTKGFEAVTLEEVAERAGLHVQTLFRHFPTKNALASAVDRNYLERFRARFEDPNRTDDTLTLWRNWIDECSREQMRSDGGQRYRKHIRHRMSSPWVSNNLLEIWHEYEVLLTRGLADDFGVDPENDPLPCLVACMLWGGNVNASRRWVQNENIDQTLNEVCVGVVDSVIELFGHRVKRRRSKTAKPVRGKPAV